MIGAFLWIIKECFLQKCPVYSPYISCWIMKIFICCNIGKNKSNTWNLHSNTWIFYGNYCFSNWKRVICLAVKGIKIYAHTNLCGHILYHWPPMWCHWQRWAFVSLLWARSPSPAVFPSLTPGPATCGGVRENVTILETVFTLWPWEFLFPDAVKNRTHTKVQRLRAKSKFYNVFLVLLSQHVMRGWW